MASERDAKEASCCLLTRACERGMGAFYYAPRHELIFAISSGMSAYQHIRLGQLCRYGRLYDYKGVDSRGSGPNCRC